MNSKGQGALEYLLLIAGAVLVAAVVIAIITGIPSRGTIDYAVLRAQCAALPQDSCGIIDPDGSEPCVAANCLWSAATDTCNADPAAACLT